MMRSLAWARSSVTLLASAASLSFLAASLLAAQTAKGDPPSLEAQNREIPRRSGLPAPEPVEPPPKQVRFIADPLLDGAVLSLTLGTGALSEAILATGEIKPQPPGDPAKLLSFDRATVDQPPVAMWGTVSAIGLFSALGFAAVDPVLSGFRDGTETAIVDAVIYAETVSVTWTTTNLAKIAFRRPRPSAYREAQRLREAGVPETEIPSRITDTSSALSFFSGHGSTTAGIAATASYLAFARAPGTPRPWITLGVGAVVTTVTCVGRVQSGEHFPTDVIAGAMAGFGIGILVAHSHRAEAPLQRPIWIGAAPIDDGGIVTVSGFGLF